MRKNKVKQMMAEGKPVVNGWLQIPSTVSAEVMAHQGWDSLTVDMQHGLVDYTNALPMLQTISSTDVTPLARVNWNEPGQIMKILDAGCYGIICPMVSNKEEAERFVQACMYPPRGYRSFGPVRGLIYGGHDYAENENDEILINAQKNNEGVLLLFRHSVFLELSARLISEKFPIYGMERPNNNEVIQKIQQRGRLKAMKGLTSNANVNQLIDWLKEGKTVLYGPDQDYRNKRSVVSKFFNKKCLTTTVPYTLKKVTGCKLIYLDFYKTSNGYKFIFEDISNIADSKENFADKINEIIERSVTKAPEHYLWHHRRFKSQAPEIYD